MSVTNAELFDLEMKHIFESNWVYLAHESQISANNDYYTTWIGRQPIVITRDKTGKLHAVLNACAHKGAMLCRRKHGNKGSFTCPFHNWTFSNTGKLLKVKDEKIRCNSTSKAPTICVKSRASRAIGVFCSAASTPTSCRSKTHYLGETKTIIDQIVGQAPDGIEVLGNSSYIYDGNWKMQMENGCDSYHVSTVHWNYATTMGRRKIEGTKAVDANGWIKSIAGMYGFEHGHILLWTNTMNPEVQPVYQHREEIAARVGEEQAKFIVNQTRNLCLSSVFLMNQFSTQICVVRPISVDKTEISIFCFALKGRSATDRATRIRQYEDFFNATGMGTSDDLEECRACQQGYAGITAMRNDLSRGAPLWVHGPDENAMRMGIRLAHFGRAQ